MPEDLKTTPLWEEHQKQGAKITVFHGWKMPLEFKGGARAEHGAVRKRAGLFDISYMGKIRVQGKGAGQVLQRLLTNEVRCLKKNQAQYTLLCNEAGGIEDDLVMYCVQEGTEYLLCVNGSRVGWDLKWIQSRLSPGEGVVVRDESSHWGLVALQGPLSPGILSSVLNQPAILNLKRFCFQPCAFEGGEVVVCATGYTGERGFEIFVPRGQTVSFWKKIMAGPGGGPEPAGLAARDTLRIEMKYPLYGQDLTPQTDPYSAGLGGVVKNTGPFTGQKALSVLKSRVQTRWVGFELMGKGGVPRPGAKVFLKGQRVGAVSSGAFSPCLNKMIGMAHVKKHLSHPGQVLEVSIHQNPVPAKVVDTPFINR